MSELEELRDRYHRSVGAFIRGDPEPQKALWSHRDDTTLANPLGPPVKGWADVARVMDSAASMCRDGEGLSFDTITFYETPHLAYEVAIQRCRLKFGASEDIVPVALRVTTVFRREDEGWKPVHRHADSITEEQRPESVVQPRAAGRQ